MAERLKAISNALKMPPKLNENGIPSFDDLPLREGDPHHSAWGLYGDKDELGTLNRLTDERVAAAARAEIKKGIRVSLNWPLDAQGESGFFQRKLFHQELFQKPPRIVNDDVWTFNTQVSSQWDGFRHFGYQKEKKFYNGVTLEDIHGKDANGKKTTVNGIHGESGGRGWGLKYPRCWDFTLRTDGVLSSRIQPSQSKGSWAVGSWLTCTAGARNRTTRP